MAFEYVEVEEAIKANGLRMVVVPGVPSPWGEAAKGILHIKGIDWKAVRLVYDSPALDKWAGQQSGPVAIYNDETPLDGWEDILMLAERLAPTSSLLPEQADDRSLVLELSHDLVGKGGLAWSRRLQQVHAGLEGKAGFNKRVAQYLAMKYDYSPENGIAASKQVIELLGKFASRLKAQSSTGSPYYLGKTVTAVDVYSAAVMAIFAPLAHEHCAMNDSTRAAFEALDDATNAALDPVLLAHRDMMYERHLELPLTL